MEERLYLARTPWITFQFQATVAPLWARLGEALSKCQHLAGTPLKPARARELAAVYMRRGALSSSAIEGNTLTEEDLKQVFDDGAHLPPSREYLEREVANILSALHQIDSAHGQAFWLTPQWLQEHNKLVLQGLEVDEHVRPGEYTTAQLVVGRYRAAPPEDVPYLVDRLCAWLNEDYLKVVNDPSADDNLRFFSAFIAATLAHLYVAWIHPFGDGNGRTARLLQVAILTACGVVPRVSTNLLSDFYNQTRADYYRRLDAASKRGDVAGFLDYSTKGFVDKLREQIAEVQEQQRQIAWADYVHEVMHDQPSGHAKDRRRDLALALPDTPLTQHEIVRLNIDLAIAYVGSQRRLARDLGKLMELGLVKRVSRTTWASNIEVIDAFKP